MVEIFGDRFFPVFYLMEEYQVERDVCNKQVLEAVQSLAQEKPVTVGAP